MGEESGMKTGLFFSLCVGSIGNFILFMRVLGSGRQKIPLKKGGYGVIK